MKDLWARVVNLRDIINSYKVKDGVADVDAGGK